jgi:hypothetical protein
MFLVFNDVYLHEKLMGKVLIMKFRRNFTPSAYKWGSTITNTRGIGILEFNWLGYFTNLY